MADLYISLIHYPILNKEGKTITTSVTNFDLHDLSRNATTFGVKKVFVVTPSEVQIGMVNYIKDYWINGYGAAYNPSRRRAIENLSVEPDLEHTCLTIEKLSGKKPLLVATTAKKTEKSVSYSLLREKLLGEIPILLAFGTGFGLAPEFMEQVDDVLEPINGPGEYNHLPVRSAVAIILDRLAGRE